ncbi:unnamed protein product [Gordionus sp. m RMFG-2023]|uniref:calcitonin gene-related peptide type 1 receptor-like isoform X2 n=1 Tax=Gordionus sp. m RMFG-2023 TaxID=3053472 RepID=UPI0030E35E0B
MYSDGTKNLSSASFGSSPKAHLKTFSTIMTPTSAKIDRDSIIDSNGKLTATYVNWLNSFPSIKDSDSQRQSFKHCLKNFIFPYHSIIKNKRICPPTFDGYGCWNQTLPGTRTFIDCPDYVTGFDPQRKAFKDCLPDGTWYKHPFTNKTWSNYTTCIDIGDYELRKKVINLYIIGYSISLIFILLAIFIFWKFKTLNCTRIRIHQQLFISFIGNNLSRIILHSLTMNPAILLQNQVSCQVLHIIAQYFMTCNYMWMFCEGLYLHTLIIMALRNLKHILSYLCIVGWGLPFIMIIAYITMRKLYQQTLSCWTNESKFKWIINGPIIISMILSFVFLCNIIRILVAKLTSINSAERHQTSKAVKATLILLPLLGIHFLVMPIRPPKGSHWEAPYEYFSVILVSFQGLFVAGIFCFLNGEVINCLKTAFNSSSCIPSNKTKYSQVTMKPI